MAVALLPSSASRQGLPQLCFGLAADFQYANKRDANGRHYSEAIRKCETAVKHWNAMSELSFVLQLGDLIDGNEDDQATRADLIKIAQAFEQSLHPVYHVLGNHCLSLPRSEVLQALQLQHAYYSFTLDGGWRFIVLDTQDISLNGWEETTVNYQQAKVLCGPCCSKLHCVRVEHRRRFPLFCQVYVLLAHT